MFRTLVSTLAFTALFAGVATAHEYYLMPESFTPQSKTEFNVSHRLGQRFKGNEMPYIDQWNIRSEIWENGKKREVAGETGDRPALKITSEASGLTSIVHQSNIDFLTFKTWEKFVTYTDKEGIEHAQSASEEGTKPKIDLVEAYARYAKTLVDLGDTGTGVDTPTGLTIELVALAHPSKLTKDQPMPVQLLYKGEPLANARVKVFVGIDTEFAHQINTDVSGKVMIPAGGPGPYLLNAIHITEPQSDVAKKRNAHWESFWASLTFSRKQ